MGTLICTLENVTEYSSLNGSERLKTDSSAVRRKDELEIHHMDQRTIRAALKVSACAFCRACSIRMAAGVTSAP